MKLIYLVLSLFLVQVAVASKPYFLDEDDDFDLRNVAKKVCWSWSGARNQITRYSTIEKLVQYFETLPAKHELSSCAKNHLKSLKALLTLTSTGNDDVCGEEKLALIEKFHHENFGTTYKSHLIELPRVLRAFFFQYASRISNICAIISHSYFRSKLDASETIKLPELDSVLQQSVQNLSGEHNITSYEDLYLVWSILDRFSKKIHNKMSDYLVEGPKKLVVRMPGADNLGKLQEICVHSIKPVYSQTILPALRLIDLGYYPDETDFLYQLQNNKFVNRLYKLTVLCETILPVMVLDSNQNDNHTYLVKPVNVDPSTLKQEQEPEPELEKVAPARIIDPVSLVAQVKLPLGSPDYAFRRCRDISADVKSREKSIAKIVKLTVKGMKKKSYNNVKLWETKQSIEPMVKEVAQKVEVGEPQSRRKRSLRLFFRDSVLMFQNVFFAMLLCIFFVIDVIIGFLVIVIGLLSGIVDLIKTASAKIRFLTLNAVAQDWVERRK